MIWKTVILCFVEVCLLRLVASQRLMKVQILMSGFTLSTTKPRVQFTLQGLNYVRREVCIHIQLYCLGIECAVHKHTGATSYSRINVPFGHMIRVILEIINDIFSFVLWFVDLGLWFFSTQNIYYFGSTLLLVKEHNRTF